jgi:hypothetical protein
MGIDAKLDGGLLQQLEIMAQRKRIRVMGLQQESLDMDLLEEEWRRHFGLRTPNEVVLNTGGLLNSQ